MQLAASAASSPSLAQAGRLTFCPEFVRCLTLAQRTLTWDT
jgi:hypothetical protein